jgi:hypothetical protein
MGLEHVYLTGQVSTYYDDIFGCPLCIRRHDRVAENE